MTPPTTARRFVVHGRVQGVGFRAFVWRAAVELGLSGWVRNLPDGTVEVLAGGTPEALERLAARLAGGPRWAVVERVEAREAPVEDLPAGFSVRSGP